MKNRGGNIVMYCKNCGKNLNQGEIFCANCGAKVENENNIIVRNNFDQNIQNPTMSNVNNLDNNINQNQQVTTIDVDQELRKAYIDKNAEKILKGRGGSAWLFLFGATYLLYRKLYLYTSNGIWCGNCYLSRNYSWRRRL